MIDEGKILNWIDEYIQNGVRVGKEEAVLDKITNELMSLTSDQDKQDEILDRLEAAEEKFEESEGGFDLKTFILELNKQLKPYTLYKGKSGRATPLNYNHLKDVDLESVTLQKGISKEHYDNFKIVLKAQIEEGNKNDVKYMGKLQEVLNYLSIQFTKKPSSQDIDVVITRAEDIFDEVAGINLHLTKGRKKVYKYWRGVSLKHKVLEDTIDELKDIAKVSEIPDEVKVSIDKLTIPPNYVKMLKPFKMQIDKPEVRVMKLLASEFGTRRTPLGKPNPYEEEHRSKRGEFLSEQKPYSPFNTSRELSGKGQFISEDSLEVIDEVIEAHVDPILYHVIDDLDISATMADSFERDWGKYGDDNSGLHSELSEMGERLQRVIDALDDSESKGRLEDVLSKLKETAGENITAYLPIANWLKNIEGLKYVEDMDKIERDTGAFFDQLGEIFIEKKTGQFPVSMEPSYPKHRPSTVGGTAATTSFKQGPHGPLPESRGMREKRGQRYVPAKKRKVADEKFAEIQKKLFEIINDYYFKPLDKSGNHFVTGEKPNFIDDVKGDFPYRLIKFNFSSTPSAKAEKQLLEGAADEINVSNLTRLKNYLGSVASEKVHEGIPKYIREVELTVDALNEIFPDSDEENKIWGAGKIGRALERTLSEVDIDEIRPNEAGKGGYFNEPLLPLYEKYKTMKEDLPINSLRTLLVGDNLQNILRGKAQWMEDKDKKKLFELIKSVLDLTDPDKINTDNEVTKAILKVHDSIRKMENKPIVYGTMYLEDINTMDYIINKMEKDFKLDITSLEINNIVKSYDSFENLSEKYGVSKEVVYTIKGLCR